MGIKITGWIINKTIISLKKENNYGNISIFLNKTIVQEIAQYRGPYIENMSFVFEKCQLGEMKRAKFLIEMMAGHESVMADLVRNSK